MNNINTKRDIWKRIDKKGENECWNYIGYLRNGYGRIQINYRYYLAHRIVYEDIYGSIPDGMCICHSCNNPSCCNPKHLYMGTQTDNMKQMVNDGRTGKGEDAGGVKLTEKSVLEIRKLYFSGEYSQKKLGEIFRVTQSNISYVINKTWKYLYDSKK